MLFSNFSVNWKCISVILKGDGEVRIQSDLDTAQSAGISGLMGLKIMGRRRGVTGAELLGEEQHPRLQLNQGDKSWGAIVSSPDSYNCFSKSWRKGHLSLLFRGSTVYLSTVFVCWESHKGQNQCLEPFLKGTGHVSSMHDFIENRNNLWPS